MITKQHYGFTKDHQEVYLYTLENEALIIKIMDYGSTIVSVLLKDGSNDDLVLGFDSLAEYETNNEGPHFGALIGRLANRLGKGKFTLNGKEYQCFINNHSNTLHGGQSGFDRKVFNAKIIGQRLIMEYISPDQEEGFPGTLNLAVSYYLEGQILKIEYDAHCDADTILNITNHSYFNLAGSGSCLNHQLKIYADHFALVDSEGLALEEQLEVKNTPFNFNEFKEIGKDIQMENEQLFLANGYDHHFIVQGEGLRLMAEAKYGQRKLLVYSDLPGLQFYTANFLNPHDFCGKGGIHYEPHAGFCLETQCYPNAINYQSVQDPIVLKKDALHHTQTWFEFNY